MENNIIWTREWLHMFMYRATTETWIVRTVAYKQAALNAIAYLMKVKIHVHARHLTELLIVLCYRLVIVSERTPAWLRRLNSLNCHEAREQACMLLFIVDIDWSISFHFPLVFLDLLLSAAPVESHVGAVVDSPNACVTLALPLGIFEHVSCNPLPSLSGMSDDCW